MTPELGISSEAATRREIGLVINQYIESEDFNSRAVTDNSKFSYKSDLAQFDQLCQLHGIHFADQLKPENVLSLISELEERYKPATVARRITCWRGFLDWGKDERRLPANLSQGLPRLRVEKQPRRSLTPEQVRDLIGTVSKKKDLRVAALVQIALQTGKKAEEIVSLNTSDVFIQGYDQVVIRLTNSPRPKGNPVFLDLEASDTIRKYFKSQRLAPGQPLFPSDSRSGRLTRQGLFHILRKAGNEVGIQNLGPTILRNTFLLESKTKR